MSRRLLDVGLKPFYAPASSLKHRAALSWQAPAMETDGVLATGGDGRTRAAARREAMSDVLREEHAPWHIASVPNRAPARPPWGTEYVERSHRRLRRPYCRLDSMPTFRNLVDYSCVTYWGHSCDSCRSVVIMMSSDMRLLDPSSPANAWHSAA